MDGQVTWSDLGILCGKMSSGHSAATEDETSTPCWKKLRVSQNQDFLYLDCRKSGSGQKQEPSTVMGGLSLGELTTLKTGEKPSETAVQEMLSVWGPHSVAEEYRLSQILEVNPLPKYNLTAKACLGILRRAERRGKDLPMRLKAVLLMQSTSGGGCDGGGKGALVQTEKSGTLGTGNDQTIFTPTPINLMVATRCKALGRGTGFGVGEPGDPANTISAAHSHGVFATAIPINDKATRWQGGGESRNHDGSGNGLGIGKEGDPSPTLTAGDRHGVAYISGVDNYNGDLTGDVASTIGVNCGMSTGRNGVMVLSAKENGGMARDSVLCAGFKLGNSEQARSIGYAEEQAPTLNAECGGNKPAVMCLNDQGGNVMGVSHDVSGTLRAQEHGHQPSILDMSHACDVIRDCGEVAPSLQARMGTGGNQIPLTYQMNGFGDYRAAEVASSCKQRDFKDSTDLAITHMVVRRLTPMECERLQGFPDGWTDIGDWVKTDKRGREIKVKGSADSPRYKALGNSIALPFWDWMLRRMARYLPEGATLGSLFDGISGFNVCWARIHGAEHCRWSSEIEQFPIAVVKKHFGDEEAGEEGDWWKFSGM